MKINKLTIKEHIFDINLVFYNFLKKITQARFTDAQIHQLLTIYYSHKRASFECLQELFFEYIESLRRKDRTAMAQVVTELRKEVLDVFVFALTLNTIKALLLQEAKLTQTIKVKKLEGLHPLSLEYDTVSTQVAYATRISGALLALLFFEKVEKGDTKFMSKDTENFLREMSMSLKSLMKKGIEPNQIFMLLFSESINQSITSSAGASYEDRIRGILLDIGIPNENIEKVHDVRDSSTEFDFFFSHKGRTFGIGAKRTLRERYKQFIKTSHMSKIDVMIEITLGTDLRETMMCAIRGHGVYLFVADEVYKKKRFLQDSDGVYPASALSKKLLESLV
jgi:hypothetical protein